MTDVARIKRNLGKMVEQGAPEADLDAYLASEGFKSAEAWRAASDPKALATERGRADAKTNGPAQAFGQGIAQGYGDEITAGVRSAAPGFSNWMMSPPALQRDESIGGTPPAQTVSNAPTFDQRYEEELTRERAKAAAFRKDSPKTATALNIGGAALPFVAAGAAGVPLGVGGGVTMGSVGGNAAIGAGIGGAAGFGEGEGGLERRLASALTGATFGGAVGAAAPIVGSALRYGYEKVAPHVLRAVGRGADKVAPKVQPQSLSAAAPDSGPPIVSDSVPARVADSSRAAADRIERDAALRRLAIEVDRSGGTGRAQHKLTELGDEAFLADTSKGVERLANTGYNLPGSAPDKYEAAFRGRNARTGDRFLASLPDAPPAADVEKFLAAYKRQTGSDLYNPILRGDAKFNISDEMRELLKVPTIRETMDGLIENYAKNGVNLTAAEAAHLVKQTLNESADAAYRAGNPKPGQKFLSGTVGNRWEKALWDANPQIKAADEQFAKVASLPDWHERGRGFMRGGTGEAATNVSPSALAADMPKATPEQRLALQVGATNTMQDTARDGAKATRRLASSIEESQFKKDKLVEIFGREKAEEIIKRSGVELAYARTMNNVLGGSQTAQRLASVADDAALTIPSGGPTSPASLVQYLADKYNAVRQPNEAIRSRIADLAANPDAATNAETLKLIESMIRRGMLPRSLVPGAASASGGQLSSPR